MAGGTQGTLVGREALVGSVLRCLERERVVTLTGRQGVGKSSVALAASQAHALVAGCLQVVARLDGADTSAAYAARVLAALPGSAPCEPSESAVAARLGCAIRLLVLDGCHATEVARGFVAALLAAAPDLRVVVTAPVALALPEEQRIRVPPLPLPPPDEDDPAALAAFPAVALFSAAAEAAAPEIVLEGGDLVTVAEVCRRLDGLPRAIVLAAGRLGLMRPVVMLQEMTRVGGWELVGLSVDEEIARLVATLDGPTTRVGCALSTMSGGATLEALAAVAALPERDVVSALEVLADLQLAQVDQAGGRYALTWGALEHLRRTHDDVLAGLAGRHAQFYADSARAFARRDPATAVDQGWLLDHRNRLVALETLRSAGERTRALRLAVDCMPGFEHRGELDAGRRLLAGVVGEVPESTSGACIQSHLWLGRLEAERADSHTGVGLAHLQTALRLARECGDLSVRLHVLNAICENQVVLEDGVRWSEQAVAEGLALTQEPSLVLGRSVFQSWRAASLHRRHRVDEALVDVVDALDTARRWGDRRLVMSCSIIYWQLPSTVRAQLHRAPSVPAIPSLPELLDLAREQGDVRAEGQVHLVLCGNALDDDELHEAVERTLDLVRHARRLQQRPLARQAVVPVLRLLGRRPQPRLAALLGGVLSWHAEGLRAHLPPRWVTDAEATLSQARVALGRDAFAAAHRQGLGTSLWEATDVAEQWLLSLLESLLPIGFDDAAPVVPAQPQPPAQERLPPGDGTAVLTPRESDVLAGLAGGGSNKEIARDLGMRPKTVAHHCAAIYAKLGVRGRTEAVATALQHGLVRIGSA